MCGQEKVSVLSLYPHIEVVISCTRALLKMLLNVWIGEEERSVISLYRILILLLPTILDFSTLNKIVPSDKSCLSVKFNSLLKNLWHFCKNRN